VDKVYPLFWARKGGIRALVLSMLKDRPMTGMDVIREIERLSLGYWRPSPGTIYPILKLLEEERLVRRRGAGGRKVYELTEEGRRTVRLYSLFLPAKDVDDIVTQMEAYVNYLQDYVKEVGEVPPELKDRLKKLTGELKELLEGSDG